MDQKVIGLLKALIDRLVKGDIVEIVIQEWNGRLSKDEIVEALKDYPGEITQPPLSAYERAVEYDIFDAELEARKIEFVLWFDDEESDLTLSLDVRKSNLGGACHFN